MSQLHTWFERVATRSTGRRASGSFARLRCVSSFAAFSARYIEDSRRRTSPPPATCQRFTVRADKPRTREPPGLPLRHRPPPPDEAGERECAACGAELSAESALCWVPNAFRTDFRPGPRMTEATPACVTDRSRRRARISRLCCARSLRLSGEVSLTLDHVMASNSPSGTTSR